MNFDSSGQRRFKKETRVLLLCSVAARSGAGVGASFCGIIHILEDLLEEVERIGSLKVMIYI